MVFQNYALYPHMRVYDNMAYGLRNRGTPKDEIETRVREAARSSRSSDFLERKPRALSGGQRQRVAMGRAIVRKPKVFLFDEPLSNLDAKLRVSMRVEIKKLQRRFETTSIYVTHDQLEAMTLADMLVVMNGGPVEQIGAPLDIYEQAGDDLRRDLHRRAADEPPARSRRGAVFRAWSRRKCRPKAASFSACGRRISIGSDGRRPRRRVDAAAHGRCGRAGRAGKLRLRHRARRPADRPHARQAAPGPAEMVASAARAKAAPVRADGHHARSGRSEAGRWHCSTQPFLKP